MTSHLGAPGCVGARPVGQLQGGGQGVGWPSLSGAAVSVPTPRPPWRDITEMLPLPPRSLDKCPVVQEALPFFSTAAGEVVGRAAVEALAAGHWPGRCQ